MKYTDSLSWYTSADSCAGDCGTTLKEDVDQIISECEKATLFKNDCIMTLTCAQFKQYMLAFIGESTGSFPCEEESVAVINACN